jgi:ABC-type xylose transport system permease subunit
MHRAVSGLGSMLAFRCICMVLHSEKNLSPVFGPSSSSTYACMLVFHCIICIVLYSEKTFSPVFGPSSGAETLNAKNIWDEDLDAILKEIGTGEKVLIMMRKHHFW